jgi:hypothetical protein
MTPEIMRWYLAAHAPELEVVELPEAHTTEYIFAPVDSPTRSGGQDADIARRWGRNHRRDLR